MQYIFGTRLYDGQQCEYLKTEGEDYTNLQEGTFQNFSVTTPDATTTHKFRIIRKFKKNEDKQGNFCTWYYIDSHSIDTDRSQSLKTLLQDQKEQLLSQSNIIDEILVELLHRRG